MNALQRCHPVTLAAGACLLLAALGWAIDPARFYPAWLAAFTFAAMWPLGSLALLLIHPLTGGRWGEAVRPGLLLGLCALPVLLPALLPILAGLPRLYEWARPGAQLSNAFYLNVPFFAARGAVYLVTWFGLAALVLSGAAARVAAPGLFALAVTFTFAAIDTTLSLDPRFSSTVYGMVGACGAVLLALAAAVLATAATAPEVRADLSKLLLALVILWAYLDFMQLLIVWQSDLADETPWYLLRSRGFWGGVRLAVAAGHVLLPVALLLSPRLQRSRAAVVAVAALLIAMEVLRSWWTVLPAFGRGLGFIDVAAMAGLGFATVAGARAVSRMPLAARARPSTRPGARPRTHHV